ncbi:hypothetical protein [Streptomyces sp. NPDC051993]|uniref:hypothetical protein n=1 Tax=Streptomyces sp. NPDC051993 TaxID=3155286 RepID=UPI00342A6635
MVRREDLSDGGVEQHVNLLLKLSDPGTLLVSMSSNTGRVVRDDAACEIEGFLQLVLTRLPGETLQGTLHRRNATTGEDLTQEHVLHLGMVSCAPTD